MQHSAVGIYSKPGKHRPCVRAVKIQGVRGAFHLRALRHFTADRFDTPFAVLFVSQTHLDHLTARVASYQFYG